MPSVAQLIDPRIGKAGVGAEIKARDLATIAQHDRFQHALPSIGAMNIAGAQSTSVNFCGFAGAAVKFCQCKGDARNKNVL